MAKTQHRDTEKKGMTWLLFALLTVAAWGVYGIFLHAGAMGMGDPLNGRYKAFLLVGVAYFVTAVLAPLFVLISNGADWHMPFKGMGYSFVAGIVGAIGAFGVLLAFGAKGSPAVVMSIIFAGAPVVNALVAMALHPPKGGWGNIPTPFWIGIGLAAIGGCMVTMFKPGPPPPKQKTADAPAAVQGAAPGGIDASDYRVARRD